MTAPADPRYVRITVQDAPALSEAFLLDDEAAPSLDNGFGGWEDQSRDGRRAIPVYSGPGSWQQTFGVFLEAWGSGRAAAIGQVRSQWKVLQALWSIPHDGQPPSLAIIEGKALMLPAATSPGRNWALTAVTPRMAWHAAPGDGIDAVADRDTPGGATPGELVRWAGTLTFTRVAPQDTLRISKGPNAGRQPYVVQAGDTIAKIMAKRHVKLYQIRLADGTRIRDAKAVKLKPRQRLWLYPAEHVAPKT